MSGGMSPRPKRQGSGGQPGSGSSVSLLEHVTRALQRARGSLYSQAFPPVDPVGIECHAFARAIVFDGYGQNDRLSYAFMPTTMQDPNLGRWEKIFAIPGVLPTDVPPVRRARVAAAFKRFATSNATQSVSDAMAAVLGPLYAGLVTQTPATALSFVNGIGTVTVNPAGGGSYTTLLPAVVGTPDMARVIQVTITGSGGYGIGTYSWQAVGTSVSGTGTIEANNVLGSTGLTLQLSNFNTYMNGDIISFQVDPTLFWWSTIAMIDVCFPFTSPFYELGAGTAAGPNSVWWNLVGQAKSILDSMLPGWATFNVIAQQSTALGFFLDQPNLDGLCAFGA
jgi:hypothetical protein